MHITRSFRTWRTAILAALFAVTAPLGAQSPRQQDLLVDTFAEPTTQAQVGLLNVETPGYPCLTAAPDPGGGTSTIPNCNPAVPDPPGQGALRFTGDATGAASSIVSTNHLPTVKGLRISFLQYQYAGHGTEGPGSDGGGDGIAFFLATAPPLPDRLGPQGGALGYASDSGTPGLSHAWLGFGLDAFGFFSSPDFFGSAACPALTWTPLADQVSVRGPEHDGYCLLSSSAASGGLPGGVKPSRTRSRFVKAACRDCDRSTGEHIHREHRSG